MPHLKFLTFDFNTAKKRVPSLDWDRKTQVIQNIEQPHGQEIPVKKPSHVMRAMVVVLLAVAAFSFSRYAVVQRDNFTLSGQVKELHQSIQALESENKTLGSKIEAAEKERQKLKAAVDSYKKENESVKFQAQKSAALASSAVEEKTYLEEILINKTKEIEKLKAGGTSAVPSAVLLGNQEDLARRLSQKEEEIKSLADQNRILSDKLQKLYQTADEKMREINLAKIALEDTISGAKKIIDNEYSSINLGSIAVGTPAAQNAEAAAPAAKTQPTARTSAKTQGRVLAINEEHGFVVVDMGKVDGIKNGMDLFLKKNGQTVATLAVLEIRDVMTACNIRDLASGKKVEINDLVSVQN